MKIKLRLFKGFTLMEMMVVIVIIGLLATIMTVTYVGVKATARDTQRFDDISTIIQAVDAYMVYNNTIPGQTNSFGAHLAEACPSNLKDDLKGAGLLNKMPTDPLDSLAAQGDCSVGKINDHGSQIEDTYYFYGWDAAHQCNVNVDNCISINRTETSKLNADLLARFTEMNMANCGINANIGAGDDFDYCFTDNR